MSKRSLIYSLPLALILALLMLRVRSSGKGPLDTIDQMHRAARQVPIEMVSSGGNDGTREPTSSAGPDDPIQADFIDAGDTAGVTIRGIVLDGDALAPVEAALVKISIGPGQPGAEAETDSEGAFLLDLDARWTLGRPYPVTVADKTGRVVYLGAPVLAPEMVLAARRHRYLYGQIVSGGSLDPRGLTVSAYVGPRGVVRSDVFAGKGACDQDGRFIISALFDQVPRQVRLTISYCAGNGVLRIVDQAIENLLTEPGPTIEVDPVRLNIHVREQETGAALPGASVGVASEPYGAAGAIVFLETEPDGIARCMLGPGTHEAIVAKDGYGPASLLVRLAPNTGTVDHDVLLSRLDTEDRLAGIVLAEDGTPLPGAIVTTYPELGIRELSTIGMTQSTCDASGRFEVRGRVDGWTMVVAYDKELGMSPVYKVQPSGREVVIRIPNQGMVEVDIALDAVPWPWVSGPVQWMLVDRDRDAFYRGHSWQTPIYIREVPYGRYNLYAYLEGSSAYAEGPVHVESRHSVVSLASRPAAFVQGQVRNEAGAQVSGASARLRRTSWPEEVIDMWGQDTTASDGRFRLLAPEPGTYGVALAGPVRGEWQASTEADLLIQMGGDE